MDASKTILAVHLGITPNTTREFYISRKGSDYNDAHAPTMGTIFISVTQTMLSLRKPRLETDTFFTDGTRKPLTVPMQLLIVFHMSRCHHALQTRSRIVQHDFVGRMLLAESNPSNNPHCHFLNMTPARISFLVGKSHHPPSLRRR